MQFDARTVAQRHSGNLNCNLSLYDEHFIIMVTERHR